MYRTLVIDLFGALTHFLFKQLSAVKHCFTISFPLGLALVTQSAIAIQCELIYETDPHPDAQHYFNDEKSVNLTTKTWQERRQLAVEESKKITTIIQASPTLHKAITVERTEVIQGGYEGKTNPALKLLIEFESDIRPESMTKITQRNRPPGRKQDSTRAKNQASKSEPTFLALSRALASMVGYVYLQDSVLMICPYTAIAQPRHTDSNHKTEPSHDANTSYHFAVRHTVRDIAGEDDFTPLLARYLYGMMIAQFNQVENTGYSYDTHNKEFTVLDFGSRDVQPRLALTTIGQFLNSLSQNEIKLHIQTTRILVEFPHNPWKLQTDGQSYLKLFLPDTDRKQLNQARQTFMKRLLN